MSWGIDPELQEMFYGELDERATRLSEGAAELQAGPVPADRAGAMMREAHTIKGTGRVLGFEAVAHVGEVLEDLWRGVQSGDIEINGDATAALIRVTATLSSAGRGDPVTGTPELVETFNSFLEVISIEATPLAPAVMPVEAREVAAPDESAEAEGEQVASGDQLDPEDAAAAEPGELEAENAVELAPQPDLEPEPETEPAGPDHAEAPIEELVEEAEPESVAHHDEVAVVAEEPAESPIEEPVVEAAEEPLEPVVEAAEEPVAEQAEEPFVEPVDVVIGEPTEEPVTEPVEEVAEESAEEATDAPDIGPEPELETATEPQTEPPSAPPLADGGEQRPEAVTSGEGVRHYRVDLAGLMGAVEHWARTEAVQVNGGRLYEMINDVAGLRHDVHAALGRANAEGGDISAVISQLQAKADALQSESLGLAAVPLTGLTNQLPQLIAYLAKKLNRGVAFEIIGDEDIAVDRQVMEAVGDPLRQIVVNAIHHGIESRIDRSNVGKPEDGTVTVQFSLKRGALVIVVTDDGAGVNWDEVRSVAAAEGRLEADALADPERLQELLFEPGFTTGSDLEFGGGGKGLSTVETIVESLFGRVALETEPGTGTKVTVTVPAFRALQNIVLVVAGGMEWGIPASAVEEVVSLADTSIEGGGSKRWITRNGEQVPVAAFAEIVGLEEGDGGDAYAIIINHRLGAAAFTVSSVAATRELAVKELGRIIAGPRHILGSAFLGGDMVLVVDPGRLVERMQRSPGEHRPSARVMVVDDSRGARAVVSGALASSGFLTSVAGSVAEALELLDEVSVDALVVDFSMPQADGVALVEEVRRRGKLIPIIMLSGVANHDDQERARKAGADAFFEKADFREGTLANALWKMLED